MIKDSKGRKEKSISYKDGKKHGPSKMYYKDGQLQLLIHYRNGVKSDTSKKYYENGQLYRTMPFDSLGRKHGVVMYYRKDGKVQAEVPFYHGKEQLGLKEYYLSGKLKTEYPKLVIEKKNNAISGQFFIYVYFEGRPKNTTYYWEGLTENSTLSDFPSKLQQENRMGVKTFSLPPNGFLMKTISVTGVMKTKQGHKYLATRKYNLALDSKMFF